MATEADLIQKFKDLNIPVGADFEELIHEAFIGANLVDQVSSKADDSKVVHNTGAEGISGQKMFDVAPIDKTTGNPYITRDGVPTIDLSNYPTKDQLATKADDSTVLHNNVLNTILTDNSGIVVGNDQDFGLIKRIGYKAGLAVGKNNSFKFLLADSDTITNSSNYTTAWEFGGDGKVSILGGTSFTPVSSSDVITAINAATANMVDSNKATNFTSGLQSGGVDVATAADLKSVEASAWRQLDNKYIIPPSGYTLAPSTSILYKIDDSIHTLYLSGSLVLTTSGVYNVPVTVQLGSIIKSILTLSVPYLGYYSSNNLWGFVYARQSSTNLTFLPVAGVAGITANSGANGSLAYVTYDELV